MILAVVKKQFVLCVIRKNVKVKGERKVIEVKNLVKRYGDQIAVNGLSFKIEQGKIYGFLGPNGA